MLAAPCLTARPRVFLDGSRGKFYARPSLTETNIHDPGIGHELVQMAGTLLAQHFRECHRAALVDCVHRLDQPYQCLLAGFDLLAVPVVHSVAEEALKVHARVCMQVQASGTRGGGGAGGS